MNNIATQAPLVAFIVHVPVSVREIDREVANREVLEIERRAPRWGYTPYTDVPGRLLVGAETLQSAEIQLRKEHLRLIRDGTFTSLHLSGSNISPYVRDIVWHAVQQGITIFYAVKPGSILDRYVKMLQQDTV